MQDEPNRKLRTRGALPLHGLLNMIIAGLADASVIPRIAARAISFGDSAETQICRTSDYGDAFCRLRRQAKNIVQWMWGIRGSLRLQLEYMNLDADNLTWLGFMILGFNTTMTSPSLHFDIDSNAPPLPPLYTFLVLELPSVVTVSKESDSKRRRDKHASPRMTAFEPVADDLLFAEVPKSTSLSTTYFFPDGFGASCFRLPLPLGSSSGSRGTGALVCLTGPRSATTAMVSQSPPTGTSYPCLSVRRTQE